MDTETLQAIQIIDKKIAALLAARNQLAQAFGVEPPTVPIVATRRAATVPPPPTGDANAHSNGNHVPSGRKVELARFLATYGPAVRTAIVENSGLPEGTVSYCLSDKRFFQQNADGLWAITEFSKRGLERGFGPLTESN